MPKQSVSTARRTRSPEVGGDRPRPTGSGEALVRHEAVGLNYIDVYHRSGLYPCRRCRPPRAGSRGVVAAIGRPSERWPWGTRGVCRHPTRRLRRDAAHSATVW